MPSVSPKAPSRRAIGFLGTLYLFLCIFLVYNLVVFWPTGVENGAGWQSRVSWFTYAFDLPDEMRLLWLVIIAAALGSYVHTVTSFASYVGNRTFAVSWLWWYLLRPPIGIALALVFYFVFRGGLLSTSGEGSDVSPYGVAALSGLVGMFSKQATDKLRETFDSLFSTEGGDRERRNKLEGGGPIIKSLLPESVTVNAGEMKITVRGEKFAEGACVLVNEQKRATTFTSESELVFVLEPSDTAVAKTLAVVVKAPPPSEELSGAWELEVTEE